jgi:Enoyl-CoA hydratase/carnithine racemase
MVRTEMVRKELHGGVALLTLTNERRRNSITVDMVEQFVALMDEVEAQPAIGAVVVTGAGEAFCAGADLRHLVDVSAGGDGTRQSLRAIYTMFHRLYHCNLPTVAAVNGPAVGAGLNLALACDVRIAGESALFSTRFLELGLHPGGGHTWMLREAVGAQTAKAMVLFNENLNGREAERIGLVWRCVRDEDLLPSALALAEQACRDPQEVVKAAKATLREARRISEYDAAVDYEIEKQLWSVQRDDFRQRIAAMTAAKG